MILFAISFLIFFMSYLSALSNPSAAYCENLGYVYEINQTTNGDVGICAISENVKLDAWSFFEGKVGQQYSYCAKNGYSTKTISDGKNAYSEDYTVCVNSATKTTPVDELMNFSEKLISDKLPSEEMKKFSSVSNVMKRMIANLIASLLTGNVVSSFTAKFPQNFDWRNQNGNWLTPVKNQGSCGSCWAFATVGDAESKIKIARNDSNFNIDLSEQDLVSCGVPLGFYGGSFGGCAGATLEDPLSYINNTGITDEACFSYTSSDESCSNKCSSANKRLWKINNYGYIPLNRQDMKNDIITKGPIIVGIYMAGSFVDGIYTCVNPGSNLNHAVVIVGYNDTGKYWIAKNSWGSNWNGDGYFNVGYGKCNIETYPMFVDLQINSTQRINTNNISINSGIAEGNYSDLYYLDNLFMNYKCNETNCSYDIQNAFPFSNFPHLTSLDVITYQNSSNGEASLNYLNNASWSSLGTISQIPYLVKYNLCSSFTECSNLLFNGNVFLKYLGTSSTSVDLLYLEATKTYCTDNWTLDANWSSCQINDTQYKNYYDANQCYQNASYINRTETQFCDYCLPNWTANEICNPDNSSTTWYNDSNSCFLKTNLSSDLQGMPINQTIPNSCSLNNSTIENVSFCGDLTCNVNENCSSCSADCGVCPAPTPEPTPPAPSAPSGGGGGGSAPITTAVASNPTANNTNSPKVSSSVPNQTVNESVIKIENKKPFSLTGLIVSVQNNSSLRIILMFIIAFGTIIAFFLIRKEKFSRRNVHKNMMRVKGKRK